MERDNGGFPRRENRHMVAQSMSELEDHRKFLENRAKFPLDELAQRAGRWVAWSPDGARIVAEADDPECPRPARH